MHQNTAIIAILHIFFIAVFPKNSMLILKGKAMKKTRHKFNNNSEYFRYLYGLQSSKSFIFNNEQWKYVYSYLKNKKHINDNLLKKTAQIPLAGDITVTPLAGDPAPATLAGDAAPTAQAGDKEK